MAGPTPLVPQHTEHTNGDSKNQGQEEGQNEGEGNRFYS